MTDYSVSENRLSLYEMNRNTRPEESALILLAMAFTMFAGYCMYKVMMYNALRDNIYMAGVEVLERVTETVNMEQEDMQQDLRILQGRIAQYSELEEEVRALREHILMYTKAGKLS
jgi:hypothetical protein